MKKNLPIQEIKEKYLNGESTVVLGKQYGCSYKTIQRHLASVGIFQRYSKKEVLTDHKKGMPVNDISEKYHISVESVYYVLRCFLGNRKTKTLPILEIYMDYLKGNSIDSLCDLYGYNYRTVVRKIKEKGYPYPVKKASRNEIKKIIEKWNEK